MLSAACMRCLAGEADDLKFSVSEHSNTRVLLTKDILITKVEIIGSLALSGHGKNPQPAYRATKVPTVLHI